MNEIRDGLIAEVEFWCELIDQSDFDQDSLEFTRMQQALKLARARLLKREFELMSTADSAVKH